MKKSLFLLLIIVIAASCNNNNSNDNATTSTTFNAEETVNEFVNLLSTQNFQEAFNLTANPNWGTYSEFSSTNAFGGITMTIVYDLETVESSNEKATVYAEVAYFDDANGTDQFQQNFYLQKYGNDWKIVDMKLVDDAPTNNNNNNNSNTSTATANPVKGVYTNGSIYLIIYDYSTGDESFEGVLLNKSNGLCVSGMDVFFENNKWSSDDIYDSKDYNSPDCYAEFAFSGNSVTIKSTTNCYGLNSTLTKSSSYSSPSYGIYSYETSSASAELEVTEIDYYGISFSLNVGTQDACTGDIPEDGYGTETAYGANGAYIYDNEDGCTLLITFSGSKATISEIQCDLHGYGCSFNGTYVKD